MSDTPTPDEREPRTGEEKVARIRGNRAVLPIVLIAAGVLLLLGRIGWFDWNLAFGILQLWPLLLIAVGADILTQGRYRAIIVIAAVVIGAVMWRVPAWSPLSGAAADVQTIEYPLDDARRAEIDIDHGVGVLSIDAIDRADGALVIGTIATGRGETFDADFRVDDGVAELDLRSEQRGTSFGISGRNERRWDLDFAPGIPIELTIDSGVGESTLDLRDLTLTGLDLNAGVGEVSIVLPEIGGYEAVVDAGVGEVVVRIPRDVEIRMEIETGLGGVDVNGTWIREGDEYRSEGYDAASADERILLDISGGVGRIVVDRID